MPEKVDPPTGRQSASSKTSAGSSLLSKTASEKKATAKLADSNVDLNDTQSSDGSLIPLDSVSSKSEKKPTVTTVRQSTATSTSTIQSSKPTPLPLPKVKIQSTPIQIPKVINTPEGTIPLNSNINNSMKKSSNSKVNISHSTKASAATKASNTAKPVPAFKSTLPTSSNISSTSTYPALKHNETGLVPIQPNPNTTPSIQFHPIAIKPKPKSIQSASTKTRTKSVSLSRSNSGVSPLKKELQTTQSNSTITLSTSKNWVLPPRPKTKKISKKKEKKVVKSNLGDINLSKTGPVTVKKLPGSNVTSASPSPSPSLPADIISPSPLLRSNTPTSKVAVNSVKTNENTMTKSTVHNSSKCTSPKCTICSKVCIANGIRSVYQDKITGKVLINAQIHSNINLYTNNEKELEVQLQHVSRENDNLKKILLKLNKEIQNLRIAKKKEESSSQCIKKIKSAKLERSSTPMDMNVPSLEGETAKTANFGFANTIDANTINPVNLSFTADNKRQKVTSVSPELLDSNLSSPKLEPSDNKRSTAKSKVKGKSKKTNSTTALKEYHPCGICESNKKCICFENTTKSIASGIVQAFSGGNSKILGIGNKSGVTSMKTQNSVGTLATMLQREDIMKKFKEDRTGVKPYSGNNVGKDNINLNDDIVLKSNEFPSLNMIDNKNTAHNEEMMISSKFEEDDSLLQMIDAELLLDPTPMVPSKLMKKPGSTDMKKSESKNSDQNSMDYFNRGTLMDFNPFNSNDMMIHDDFNELNNDTKLNDTLKNNNDVSMTPADPHDNNDNSLHGTLLFENSIYSGDEFMMY